VCAWQLPQSLLVAGAGNTGANDENHDDDDVDDVA
jgi:hypothetical protein